MRKRANYDEIFGYLKKNINNGLSVYENLKIYCKKNNFNIRSIETYIGRNENLKKEYVNLKKMYINEDKVNNVKKETNVNKNTNNINSLFNKEELLNYLIENSNNGNTIYRNTLDFFKNIKINLVEAFNELYSNYKEDYDNVKEIYYLKKQSVSRRKNKSKNKKEKNNEHKFDMNKFNNYILDNNFEIQEEEEEHNSHVSNSEIQENIVNLDNMQNSKIQDIVYTKNEQAESYVEPSNAKEIEFEEIATSTISDINNLKPLYSFTNNFVSNNITNSFIFKAKKNDSMDLTDECIDLPIEDTLFEENVSNKETMQENVSNKETIQENVSENFIIKENIEKNIEENNNNMIEINKLEIKLKKFDGNLSLSLENKNIILYKDTIKPIVKFENIKELEDFINTIKDSIIPIFKGVYGVY